MKIGCMHPDTSIVQKVKKINANGFKMFRVKTFGTAKKITIIIRINLKKVQNYRAASHAEIFDSESFFVILIWTMLIQ